MAEVPEDRLLLLAEKIQRDGERVVSLIAGGKKKANRGAEYNSGAVGEGESRDGDEGDAILEECEELARLGRLEEDVAKLKKNWKNRQEAGAREIIERTFQKRADGTDGCYGYEQLIWAGLIVVTVGLFAWNIS
jgi:hypothetical protein